MALSDTSFEQCAGKQETAFFPLFVGTLGLCKKKKSGDGKKGPKGLGMEMEIECKSMGVHSPICSNVFLFDKTEPGRPCKKKGRKDRRAKFTTIYRQNISTAISRSLGWQL